MTPDTRPSRPPSPIPEVEVDPSHLPEDRFVEMMRLATGKMFELQHSREWIDRSKEASVERQAEHFARYAYRINAAVTRGDDGFAAAKMAAIYHLIWRHFYDTNPHLGKMVVSKGAVDYPQWRLAWGMFNAIEKEGGLDGRVGEIAEIFELLPPDMERIFEKDLERIAASKNLNQKGVQREILGNGMMLDLVYAFNIFSQCGANRDWTPFRYLSEEQTYLPVVMGITQTASIVTGGMRWEGFDLEPNPVIPDLVFALTHTEVPPATTLAGDFKAREWRGRMLNLLRDSMFGGLCPTIFEISKENLVRAGGLESLAEVWRITNALDINTMLESLGVVPKMMNFPKERDWSNLDSGELIASATGEEKHSLQHVGPLIERFRLAVRAWDLLVGLGGDTEAPYVQEATAKGVFSAMSEAVQSREVVTLLHRVINQNRSSTIPFNTEAFFSRYALISTIERIDHLEHLQPYADSIPEVENLLHIVQERIHSRPDILRMRTYFEDETVEEIVGKLLLSGIETKLMLETANSRGETYRHFENIRADEAANVSAQLRNWFAQNEKAGATRIFGAVFAKVPLELLTEKCPKLLRGKLVEVQVIPRSVAEKSWESRTTHRLRSRDDYEKPN